MVLHLFNEVEFIRILVAPCRVLVNGDMIGVVCFQVSQGRLAGECDFGFFSHRTGIHIKVTWVNRKFRK